MTGGEVIAVNEELSDKPDIVNEDPYGAGWFVIIRPDDWEGMKGDLISCSEVARPYEAKMDADGFYGCE